MKKYIYRVYEKIYEQTNGYFSFLLQMGEFERGKGKFQRQGRGRIEQQGG